MATEEEMLEEHRTSFAAFADEISNHYADMVAKASAAPKDAWEHWEAFAAAIDWNERWIQMLIGFEVMLFIVVLVFRNSYEFQSVLFLVICLLVAFSERINTLCAEHWRLFATQNYFDVHGTFAITLFSGPLLFIGLVQVIIFLRLMSSELIKAKRMELRIKRKNQGKENNDESNSKKDK